MSLPPPPEVILLLTRRKIFVVAAIVATAVATLLYAAYPSHWKRLSRESCQVCGARRAIVQKIRWWRNDAPVARIFQDGCSRIDHDHLWQMYDFTITKPFLTEGGSNVSARHRDECD